MPAKGSKIITTSSNIVLGLDYSDGKVKVNQLVADKDEINKVNQLTDDKMLSYDSRNYQRVSVVPRNSLSSSNNQQQLQPQPQQSLHHLPPLHQLQPQAINTDIHDNLNGQSSLLTINQQHQPQQVQQMQSQMTNTNIDDNIGVQNEWIGSNIDPAKPPDRLTNSFEGSDEDEDDMEDEEDEEEESKEPSNPIQVNNNLFPNSMIYPNYPIPSNNPPSSPIYFPSRPINYPKPNPYPAPSSYPAPNSYPYPIFQPSYPGPDIQDKPIQDSPISQEKPHIKPPRPQKPQRHLCHFNQLESAFGVMRLHSQSNNQGFAMSSNEQCIPGTYCPYACQPGMYSTQSSLECLRSPSSKPCQSNSKGGVYCNRQGYLIKPIKKQPLCKYGLMNVHITSYLSNRASLCQTVEPGNQEPLIPTLLYPSQKSTVTVLPYFTIGDQPNPSKQSVFFLNLQGTEQKHCQAGTDQAPFGKWSPYLITTQQERDGTTFIQIGFNPNFIKENFQLRYFQKLYAISFQCIRTMPIANQQQNPNWEDVVPNAPEIDEDGTNLDPSKGDNDKNHQSKKSLQCPGTQCQLYPNSRSDKLCSVRVPLGYNLNIILSKANLPQPQTEIMNPINLPMYPNPLPDPMLVNPMLPYPIPNPQMQQFPPNPLDPIYDPLNPNNIIGADPNILGNPQIGLPPGALLPPTLPQGSFPPGTIPPGAIPPGALAPGILPPGAFPPGAIPPGALPLGINQISPQQAAQMNNGMLQQ